MASAPLVARAFTPSLTITARWALSGALTAASSAAISSPKSIRPSDKSDEVVMPALVLRSIA